MQRCCNHGQCCCAGSRLYVESKDFDDVLQGVTDHAKSIRVGSGQDPDTDMGPLVSQEQLERVTGYFDHGREEGATFATGGHRKGERGYFVEPTVLTDTGPHMKVEAEEIFGPVVTVAPFKSLDDVMPRAHDTNYGLAAGILDEGHLQGPPPGEAAPGRHGVDQLLQRV